VLIFTTSHQSVEGIYDVMHRARAAHSNLPVARARLTAVPILSRDEREKEHDLSVEWRLKIADRLGDIYREWLPAGVEPQDVLLKLYIPQIAYWSFGERLPVIEKREDVGDARSIVAAYVRLGRFLETELDWTSIAGSEDAFPSEVLRRAEAKKREVERRELDLVARERDLATASRVHESYKSRILTGLLVAAVPSVVALSQILPPDTWLSNRMPAEWFDTVYAVMGSSLAHLLAMADPQASIPGGYVRTMVVDLVLVITSGVLAATWFESPATLAGGFQTGLVGAAFYLFLSRFLSIATSRSETRVAHAPEPPPPPRTKAAEQATKLGSSATRR
jgi:hypothetical protein